MKTIPENRKNVTLKESKSNGQRELSDGETAEK